MYPFYSMPFKGNSSYQKTFDERTLKNAPAEDPYAKTIVTEFKARMKKG